MKLTLRELFLLVALAAMGCGWWVDRSGLRAQVDGQARSILELKASAPQFRSGFGGSGFGGS
jgi:hypothetical protein